MCLSISLLDCICHQTQCCGLFSDGFLFSVCLFFLGVGFLCYNFVSRSVWPLMSTSAVERPCTLLHVVPKVCKAAGPDVFWPPPFLSLSHPSCCNQLRVCLRSIGLFLCHLGTFQSLTPHTSALVLCQDKLVSSINIPVPCQQVKVWWRNGSYYCYNFSSGISNVFQFTTGTETYASFFTLVYIYATFCWRCPVYL